jgi:hypothetical protein
VITTHAGAAPIPVVQPMSAEDLAAGARGDSAAAQAVREESWRRSHLTLLLSKLKDRGGTDSSPQTSS